MSKYQNGDRVILSANGEDRNGVVIMRDGALPWEGYLLRMQDNGEAETWHVAKLRPQASDPSIALEIVRSLKAIQGRRQQIIEEFDKLERLMVQDGQPVWELHAVREMRTVSRNVNRFEIGSMLGSWESYYDERKRK